MEMDINISYKPHKHQQLIHDDEHRFKVVVAGRRFGKSIFSRMHILLNAMYVSGLYWIVNPTYKQGKMIHWRELKKEIPNELVTYKNEQELSIELVNGSRIEIKGADNEQALRGTGLKGVVFDETAYQQPHVFWDIIRPMLLDSEGWGIFISTPHGFNWFYELYLKGLEGTKEHEADWKSFHHTSYQNPYLNPKEIEQAKKQTDEDTFSQEYLAEFKKFKGLIYKNFNRETHVIEPFEIPDDGEWEIYRGVDFGYGTNPTVCLWIAVNPNKKWYVIDEYYEVKDASDYHCGIILSKSAQYPHPSVSWCDPSNNLIIEEWQRKGVYLTPARRDVDIPGGRTNMTQWVNTGIDIIQEKLKISPVDQKPQLFIFKNCTNLIREFESYEWEEPRNELLNPSGRPKKANDHGCFCPHTEVLTQRGTLPIIDIKKGDKVWTPLGWSKVFLKEKTGTKKVHDFLSTKATSNHPILTQDGFRQLKDLKEMDNLWNVFIFKDDLIGDTQIHQTFPIKSIFAVVGRKMESVQARYISTYGGSIKGISQKVIIFIIKMGIIIETILKIWNYTLLPLILKNIQKLLENKVNKIFKLLENMQFFGINLMQRKNFIPVMVNIHGRYEKELFEFVMPAKKNIKPILDLDQNSVASTAKCGCSDYVEVYNLETDSGMFTANNVIVSNCDSLRYFAISYRGKQTYYPQPDGKDWRFV